MSANLATEPCWTADCDGCDEPLGYEEYSHMHFSTEKELREMAESCDWSFVDSKWFCATCSGRRTCDSEGHQSDEEGYCSRCDDMVITCRVVSVPDAAEIRTFRHTRKGLIIGRVVREDDTWKQIELRGDHRLAYGSESNRGRVDEAGQIITVRGSLLTEVFE